MTRQMRTKYQSGTYDAKNRAKGYDQTGQDDQGKEYELFHRRLEDLHIFISDPECSIYVSAIIIEIEGKGIACTTNG